MKSSSKCNKIMTTSMYSITGITMCFLISCIMVIGQQQGEPQLDKPETDKHQQSQLAAQHEQHEQHEQQKKQIQHTDNDNHHHHHHEDDDNDNDNDGNHDDDDDDGDDDDDDDDGVVVDVMMMGEADTNADSVSDLVSVSVSNSDSEFSSRYGINGGGGGNRLYHQLSTASTDLVNRQRPSDSEQLLNYEAPDDCYYQTDLLNNQPEILLTCNLRTINSELDTTNFSIIPAQLTIGLRLMCNDEIMVRSSLEAQSFSHLQQLQILIIQYCKLANLNRQALDGLSKLRNLTIRSYNARWPTLNFEIESNAFSAVKNLEFLDLSSNNIWLLPENIFCSLSALTILNMSENCLQDVSELGFRERNPNAVGDEINDAIKMDNRTTVALMDNCNLDLEVLDVSYNHFVLLPSNGFSILKRIRILLTNNNEISMVADRALSGLKNLQIINFSSNKIVALPSELFIDQSDTIQQIYLQNNSLSVLSPKLFSNLKQLQTLDLSYNQITSTWLDSSTFAGLIRLVLLNLSHNKLTRLETEIFKDLYTLQILNLRNNQIENIMSNTFAPMNNLHTLLLSYNNIKYLEANALNGLYVLSLLSLDNNQLIGIHPEALRNCSSLENLNLNGNQLKSVPVAIRNMRLLRTLDLGENMISILEVNAFKGLSNLYGLRLIGNHLENITLYAFKELSSLQILNLARNRISLVKAGCFDMVTGIQAIRLDGNQLGDINGLFNNMPALLWLNISDNRLEHFDYALIPSSLQWLDLHQNRLVGLFNRFGLDEQIHLQTLDASFNRMPRISPASIPNSIELLFLNDNRINTIDPDTFFHKINLTRVDLYANQISTLSVKSLRILPYDSKRLIPQFYIGGNPFICDCNIDWLPKINYLKAQQYPRIMDLETIYCKLLNHRERAYIPLIEAEPKHFLCTYSTHCFAVCHCCEFDACDCEMICPANCTCYHDQTWSTNIVECSTAGYSKMPPKVPMDTTELYIDGNNFIQLPGHSFLGRKNLGVLFINNSNIELIYNTTFSGLKRLMVLHLEDNRIGNIDGSEFGNLENLRELYLQNNRIVMIANGSFQTLRKLQILRLDGNRLVYFEIWQLAMNPFLKEIGLAGNQWSCDCNYLIHFRMYLGQSNGKIFDSASISCVYNNATNILHEKNGTSCTLHEDMATYVQANEMENLLPLLLIAICTFVGFFGVICGLIYYRQELKLWLQANCLLCYNSAGLIEDLDPDRLNDAYFAYSFQDEHFVNQILAHTLERDMAYRLCLHYRDININAYTTDIILEAADTAKQIVLVLSKNFLYNEWSRFEYKSALHEIIKRRKRTVFILYGDLPQRDIDVDMRHYLRNSTCLEWDDKKFWQKLRIALPHMRSKTSAPYVSQRSTLNIYAATHEYQSSANGRLGSNTPNILINEKLCSDCTNYSTINDCTRNYGILPATATPACKFNTVNELAYKASKNSKEQQHSKTLDLQRHHQQIYQQIHQPVCVNSIHLHNYQVQHEYAVPSFYCGSTGLRENKEETPAPTYDSVVYNKDAKMPNKLQPNYNFDASMIRTKRMNSNKKSPKNYILNRTPPASPIPPLPSPLNGYSQVTKTAEKTIARLAKVGAKTKSNNKATTSTSTSTSTSAATLIMATTTCSMVSSTMSTTMSMTLTKKTNYNCTQLAGKSCRCSILLKSNSRQLGINRSNNNNYNNNNHTRHINGGSPNTSTSASASASVSASATAIHNHSHNHSHSSSSSRSNSNCSGSGSSSSSTSSNNSQSNSNSSCHTSHDSCTPDEDNNRYTSHTSLTAVDTKTVSVSEQNLSLWA